MKGLPHWRLETLYPSLKDEKLEKELARLDRLSKDLETLSKKGPEDRSPSEWILRYIEAYNRCAGLHEHMSSFAYGHYSTNTSDAEATLLINRLEAFRLPIKRAEVAFRNLYTALERGQIETEALKEYSFFLHEQRELADKQMSPEEEDLAADLSRSGSEAWTRLQESVSSTLKTLWNEATGEEKTVTQLRALAYHRDREVRRRGYRKELEAWESVKIPMAAALNGVKGFSVCLNKRRRYISTLARSRLQSRISRKTLDSLLRVMKESLPIFRTYLKTKAELLDIRKLAFFDIFAPVGSAAKTWSFRDARVFILDQFEEFSQEFKSFAARAFDEGWIDAEPRNGKVGGAFCMDLPLAEQSRVLCNFDGSFSSVTTLAHELGHAYHHYILREASHIHRDYPMTLAETASIFSENLVFERAISLSEGDEKLALLESFLSDAAQVIVDILSRFIFETEVLVAREGHELSSEQLCELMLGAQRETYGDALDWDRLHPYMWAVKSHYYSADLAYYNFPYAFGLLLGLALLADYRESREASASASADAFRRKYHNILLQTGKASAADVTKAAGFDIEDEDFWRQGLDIVKRRVEEFIAASGGKRRCD
jgi:pepF/M3 family oligoendopeptidase